MSMIKSREIRYNSSLDLLKEVERKARAGELGKSNVEILANTQALLEQGANSVEMALRKFVTADPAMLEVKNKIRLLFRRAEPVLITGPTGTGKQLLAKALTIPGEPFVAENCAAIPETLFESVFFGHVKGSFTGANSDHEGLLVAAGDGVIFLDEIGDMPLTMQAKILYAIQENEIRPVGSVETVDIGCRFVAATKYNLRERVQKGLFREDLFARLFTYSLHVTGLQERPGDIPLIVRSKLGNPDAYDEMPPFPQTILNDIYEFNVRAIEAALARWRAWENYE